MKYFKIPGITLAGDVKFSDMHVWAWAKTQARKDVCPFKYLDSCGFVVGADKITEYEFDCLKHACDMFHSCEPDAYVSMATTTIDRRTLGDML